MTPSPLFCSICERVLRLDEIWHVLSVTEEFTTCCARDQRLTLAVPPKPGWRCLNFRSPVDEQQAEQRDSCVTCGVEKQGHPYQCRECDEVVDLPPCSAQFLPSDRRPHSCGEVAKQLRRELKALRLATAKVNLHSALDWLAPEVASTPTLPTPPTPLSTGKS